MSDTFTNLAPPQTIETLDFNVILGQLVRDFQSRNPDYTAFLESDPAMKLLEVAAARELILRQRINDAFQNTLLAFATGADLDNLAVFYGLTRRAGESDEELRERTVLATQGSSAAGGSAWYRYHALSASPDVQDAAVSSPRGGDVDISILSKSGDGTPTDELLSQVQSVVLADNVRVLTDTVRVLGAVAKPATIEAQIWLLPNAPQEVFSGLEQTLRANFKQDMRLGRDLTLSWLIAQLSPVGVQRVNLISPTADSVNAANEFSTIGSLTLTDMGRDF